MNEETINLSYKQYQDLVNENQDLLGKYNNLLKEYEKIEDKYIHNVLCCNEEDCELFKKYDELVERVNKAREYVKENCMEQIPDMPNGCYREIASIGDLEELLSILQGKEQEKEVIVNEI